MLNVQDVFVILILIFFILFCIFHQLASRGIVNSKELRVRLYGFDLYESKGMDVANIQAVITALIIISGQSFLNRKKALKFGVFDKRKYPLFPALDSNNAEYINNHYKKIIINIYWSTFFGVLMVAFLVILLMI